MFDLTELRRLAKDARDEWETVHPMAAQRIIVGIGTDISHRLHCAPDAVREYAAGARPTAVIALLDRLERAEDDAARLRGLLAEAGKALGPLAIIADEYSDAEDDEFQIWKDFDVLGATLPLKRFRSARTVANKIEEALK